MKASNILNIKGALLESNQLKDYLEKLASDHILQKRSDKNTYPIPRLEENYRYITKTYELLNSNLKMGINIHPAGEWLLDNYYMLEEAVREVKQELTLKKYRNFLGISNGTYKGYARIYVLAAEIVAYTDGKIDVKNIGDLLKAYQSKKTLNMEEIWNFNLFLKIVLIENIRIICEKIYSSQMQKYKVENIIERIVENKEKSQQKYQEKYDSRKLGFGQMKYPFIEYMSYRLKRYGKKGIGYLNVLEEQVSKMGTSIADVIKKEHFDIALKKISIGNCIRSIKGLQTINFLEVFEEINGVEQVLRRDPANYYEKMDYKTKEYYRTKIAEISKKTKISEIYIANKILELSQEDKQKNQKEDISKKSHVGYYLIDKGIKDLYIKLGIQNKRKACLINPSNKIRLYISFIIGISGILSILLGIFTYRITNHIWIGILQTILIYIPIIEITTRSITIYIGKNNKSSINT